MPKIVYTLSNTSSRNINASIRVTAVRTQNDITVVSLLAQGSINFQSILKNISRYSDTIFVDVEKKQRIGDGSGDSFTGNLYKRILETMHLDKYHLPLKVYPLKMNDLTVTAVMQTLFSAYSDISGLSCSVIGVGNLGFKISMMLTEAGAHVKCYNRTTEKAFLCSKAITYFKPKETISSPEVCLDILHSFVNAQLSIIAASQIELDVIQISKLVRPSHTMFVLGHSIFKESSLQYLSDSGIRIVRIDVGNTLLSYVIGTLSCDSYNVYGSTSGKGTNLCSGGYVGEKGDLIVDDYLNPKYILGVCDGKAGIDLEANAPVRLLSQLTSLKGINLDDISSRIG